MLSPRVFAMLMAEKKKHQDQSGIAPQIHPQGLGSSPMPSNPTLNTLPPGAIISPLNGQSTGQMNTMGIPAPHNPFGNVSHGLDRAHIISNQMPQIPMEQPKFPKLFKNLRPKV